MQCAPVQYWEGMLLYDGLCREGTVACLRSWKTADRNGVGQAGTQRRERKRKMKEEKE